ADGLKSLILDEVVEFETTAGFISGPAAAPLLTAQANFERVTDPIAQLSHEAIHYAARLPITDARLLSSRLYRYNTTPCGDALRSAFDGNAQIAGMLGLAGSSPLLARIAGAGYDRVDHTQWHAWTLRTGLHPENLTYKLYVSPDPRAVVDVVEATLRIATDLRIPSFKIGRSVGNLVRPDKIVLYADSEDELLALASALEPLLAPHPAQGVPFTKCVDAQGMLSIGVDPPRSLCLSGWAQAESWRAWIADRLAIALIQARAFSKDPAAHVEFALSKLFIEGIDTRDWTASPKLWQGESA
ncbi:MAG TPA: hypothetical protein VER03_07510, partial [Bryobacteraceae bacterium]|nr:hypothetical protein [Bryobacteraceae bacterium]